jgi:hypothetical protein|nr:MAG TPA_asm: hypothetical protein [Caudoviricetes sp.]
MKKVIALLILLTAMISIVQTKNIAGAPAAPVKGECFQGYIFDKYYEIFPNEDTNFKFTPTYENVVQAEQIVYDSLILTGKLRMYPPRDYINQHFTEYQRQYRGAIDKEGDSIIYINYLLNYDNFLFNGKDGLALQILSVLDGGSDYWQVQVNLTEKTIDWFNVNGEG